MTALRVGGTVFEDLKKTSSAVSDRVEAARRALRAVGAGRLVEEVHEFSDDWGYGGGSADAELP